MEDLGKNEMRKIYNARYYNKKKQDDTLVCDVCFGRYDIFNKSHHENTQRHKLALKIMANSEKTEK